MVTLEGIVFWNNQPDREALSLVRKGVGRNTILRAVETPYPTVNPIQSNPYFHFFFMTMTRFQIVLKYMSRSVQGNKLSIALIAICRKLPVRSYYKVEVLSYHPCNGRFFFFFSILLWIHLCHIFWALPQNRPQGGPQTLLHELGP